MLSLKTWVQSAVLPLALIAASHLIEPAASGQTLRVFQAEDADFNTGDLYNNKPIRGVHATAARHPAGLIHYVGGISGLPARDLKAKFRLSKVSTVINTNSVALEVFSETRQMTLAHRVLKNLNGDGAQGYLDHHVGFRVLPGEVISLRVYFYANPGSQVKLDLSLIE